MGRFEDITFESVKQVAETPEKEINRRRIQLWYYRFLYYKNDILEVTDYEYDVKEYEYKLLREHFSTIKPRGTCPLESVGTNCDVKTQWKVNQLIAYNQIADVSKKIESITNKQLSLFA